MIRLRSEDIIQTQSKKYDVSVVTEFNWLRI
jgi:hypothetical protein